MVNAKPFRLAALECTCNFGREEGDELVRAMGFARGGVARDRDQLAEALAVQWLGRP